jgi:hypothetical protein
MEWRPNGSFCPKIYRVQKPAGKFLHRFFWDREGILLIYCLPKGQTINYYSFLLVQLKDILREKRHGKFTKVFLSSHDIVSAHQAHATKKKFAYLGFRCLDHTPSSPDLAPSDYHLSPGLKKQLKFRHFSSNAEVIAAAEIWLDGKISEFC